MNKFSLDNFNQQVILENRFIRRYADDLNLMFSEIVKSLENSIPSQNGKDVEEGLIPVFVYKFKSDKLTKVLCELLLEDWHYKHEDIVSKMQSDKNPNCIDVLYLTATKSFKYLDYDDTFGLARKCTWALSDINTNEAIDKLRLLANSENVTIKLYAEKRLRGKI